MFGIDIGRHAALLLNFGNHMQRQGGLARGFGAVNLDHAATRQPADAQRNIQAQRTGGNRVARQAQITRAQLHHRALAKSPIDLAERGFQRALAIRILFLAHYPQSRLCHEMSPVISQRPLIPKRIPGGGVKQPKYMVCSHLQDTD